MGLIRGFPGKPLHPPLTDAYTVGTAMLILGALGVEEEQMAHGALSAISGALIVAACLAGSLVAVSRRAFVPVVVGERAGVTLGAAVWMSSRRQGDGVVPRGGLAAPGR